MSGTKIKLFGGFKVFLGGSQLPLSKSASEFLALLTVAAGSKVTAKIDWEVLKKYSGFKYNSKFYSTHIAALKDELMFFELTDIIHTGITPVRYCRLDASGIECDYYQMLDGEMPLGNAEDFLPEYVWAKDCFFTNWGELRKAWIK